MKEISIVVYLQFVLITLLGLSSKSQRGMSTVRHEGGSITI